MPKKTAAARKPASKKGTVEDVLDGAEDVEVDDGTPPDGAENCLIGYVFVLTGELSMLSRDESRDLIQRYGGKVTTSVSRNTTYIVAGDDPGPSKLAKAHELGKRVISGIDLFKLIKIRSGNADSQAAERPAASVDKGKAPAKKATVTRPITLVKPGPGGSQLWVDKYKPDSSTQIIFNQKNVKDLQTWLEKWCVDSRLLWILRRL